MSAGDACDTLDVARGGGAPDDVRWCEDYAQNYYAKARQGVMNQWRGLKEKSLDNDMFLGCAAFTCIGDTDLVPTRCSNLAISCQQIPAACGADAGAGPSTTVPVAEWTASGPLQESPRAQGPGCDAAPPKDMPERDEEPSWPQDWKDAGESIHFRPRLPLDHLAGQQCVDLNEPEPEVMSVDEPQQPPSLGQRLGKWSKKAMMHMLGFVTGAERPSADRWSCEAGAPKRCRFWPGSSPRAPMIPEDDPDVPYVTKWNLRDASSVRDAAPSQFSSKSHRWAAVQTPTRMPAAAEHDPPDFRERHIAAPGTSCQLVVAQVPPPAAAEHDAPSFDSWSLGEPGDFEAPAPEEFGVFDEGDVLPVRPGVLIPSAPPHALALLAQQAPWKLQRKQVASDDAIELLMNCLSLGSRDDSMDSHSLLQQHSALQSAPGVEQDEWVEEETLMLRRRGPGLHDRSEDDSQQGPPDGSHAATKSGSRLHPDVGSHAASRLHPDVGCALPDVMRLPRRHSAAGSTLPAGSIDELSEEELAHAIADGKEKYEALERRNQELEAQLAKQQKGAGAADEELEMAVADGRDELESLEHKNWGLQAQLAQQHCAAAQELSVAEQRIAYLESQFQRHQQVLEDQTTAAKIAQQAKVEASQNSEAEMRLQLTLLQQGAAAESRSVQKHITELEQQLHQMHYSASHEVEVAQRASRERVEAAEARCRQLERELVSSLSAKQNVTEAPSAADTRGSPSPPPPKEVYSPQPPSEKSTRPGSENASTSAGSPDEKKKMRASSTVSPEGRGPARGAKQSASSTLAQQLAGTGSGMAAKVGKNIAVKRQIDGALVDSRSVVGHGSEAAGSLVGALASSGSVIVTAGQRQTAGSLVDSRSITGQSSAASGSGALASSSKPVADSRGVVSPVAASGSVAGAAATRSGTLDDARHNAGLVLTSSSVVPDASTLGALPVAVSTASAASAAPSHSGGSGTLVGADREWQPERTSGAIAETSSSSAQIQKRLDTAAPESSAGKRPHIPPIDLTKIGGNKKLPQTEMVQAISAAASAPSAAAAQGRYAALDAALGSGNPAHSSGGAAKVAGAVDASPVASTQGQPASSAAEVGVPLKIVFEPGRLGITLQVDGVVENAVEGQQAHRLGVHAGMRFLTVDGQPYTQDKLKAAMVSTVRYEVSLTAEASTHGPSASVAEAVAGTQGGPDKASKQQAGQAQASQISQTPSEGSVVGKLLTKGNGKGKSGPGSAAEAHGKGAPKGKASSAVPTASASPVSVPSADASGSPSPQVPAGSPPPQVGGQTKEPQFFPVRSRAASSVASASPALSAASVWSPSASPWSAAPPAPATAVAGATATQGAFGAVPPPTAAVVKSHHAPMPLDKVFEHSPANVHASPMVADSSVVRGVVLAGFATAALNTLYTERPRAEHRICDRETYLSEKGDYFLFSNAPMKGWAVEKTKRWSAVRSGQSGGVAHSPPDYEICGSTLREGWTEFDRAESKWLERANSGVARRGKARKAAAATPTNGLSRQVSSATVTSREHPTPPLTAAVPQG